MATVSKCFLLRSHKFGVELPKSVQAALRIYEQTNSRYWKDAIVLKIKNIDFYSQYLE
jgi:hypothetical protein